ncbi:hypothetical protein BCR33DRAFT_772703 [Rhizoclosmatium globosum]|uniref:Uncharacterized protein n=1 Tax=Rhizoclosmatium globosum TaxID=329046 RepID=A0A1Y2B1W4_9FUNG|nr:hypothetical protein BCR33DRAFT_772703 [Rhizoclosmatium globosum]|eukprot:ORY28724.1 hypothetical protein BCR33DRAFT_772703 [Rhizoclosmatium globosum]
MADDAQFQYITFLQKQITQLKEDKAAQSEYDALVAENAILKQTAADNTALKKRIKKLKQTLMDTEEKVKQLTLKVESLVKGPSKGSQSASSLTPLNRKQSRPAVPKLKCPFCEFLPFSQMHFHEYHHVFYEGVAFSGVDGIIRKDIMRKSENLEAGVLNCPCNEYQSAKYQHFRHHARTCSGCPKDTTET